MKSTASKLSGLAPLRPQKGFTLIELLVVFGIIIVVGSIGLFYYRDYGRKQTVAQAAESLRTQLTQLQQKAISGQYTCPTLSPPNGPYALTAYQFGYTAGTNNFYTTIVCTPQSGPTYTNPTSFTLPGNSNVTFDAASSDCPAIINFSPLGQGTSSLSAADSTTCRITASGYGHSASLTVKQSGNIQ